MGNYADLLKLSKYIKRCKFNFFIGVLGIILL